MATSTISLKKKIETLKKGLNNKFINASQKEKIKSQVQKLESQVKALAPKKASKPATSSSLSRLQKMVKKKKYGVYKGASVDLQKDADRPALRTGRRIAKESGKTYYEYRANRIDVKQPPKKYPKLEDGGMMAEGGTIDYSKQTSDDFKLGEIVWDVKNKEYATIIGIYDDYGSDKFEVRTEANGMQYTKYLRKVGSEGDKGTKEQLKERIEMYARLVKRFPENDYTQQRKEFVGQYAKGGSLSSIKDEYDENEDNNAHSENVVLLAKHFGTKEDLTEAKRILALHEKEGSLSSDNGKKRQQLHLKLIEKARTEMAKDGIKFAKGGGVLSNYRLTFMNDNGEKKYMTTESYNKVEAMKEGKWWEKNPDYHIAKGNYKVVSVVEVEEDDDKDTSSYKIRNERRRGIRGKGVTYNSDYSSYPNVFNPLGKPRYEDGGMMADGGVTEKEVVESNAEMVLSQIKAVKHHAEELSRVVSTKSNIEAWVVGKIERASTDLSDITHYLEGNKDKMSMGGSVRYYTHKMDK
jgi:hypothetical protein